MITLEEALFLLQLHIEKEEAEEMCVLSEASGRILAEDLTAKIDQPPFPRSPLDGYAVRAEDIGTASKQTPAVLSVMEEVLAGGYCTHRIEPKEAVRIMTGAPIPSGADAVVRQEDTDYGEEYVQVYRPVRAYENYCRRGEDFKEGDCLARAGERLDAIRIGIAAAMGYSEVRVRQRPKTAVFSTGNELRDPGEALKPGEIYDANRFLVCARLKELGADPVLSACMKDDPEEVAQCIRRAAMQVRLIITTGGVSVGKKDIMHEVITLLKAQRLFWKVRIKPGSPVMAAVYGNTCILCLSGNPFGTAAGVEVLVRPVLACLTGEQIFLPERRKALLGNSFLKESTTRRYVRAIAADGYVTIPEGMHTSGVLSTMTGCNCLLEIPEGKPGLKEGEEVWIIML